LFEKFFALRNIVCNQLLDAQEQDSGVLLIVLLSTVLFSLYSSLYSPRNAACFSAAHATASENVAHLRPPARGPRATDSFPRAANAQKKISPVLGPNLEANRGFLENITGDNRCVLSECSPPVPRLQFACSERAPDTLRRLSLLSDREPATELSDAPHTRQVFRKIRGLPGNARIRVGEFPLLNRQITGEAFRCAAHEANFPADSARGPGGAKRRSASSPK
jgi:hypothetical protein